MSFSLNKLRSLIPGQHTSSSSNSAKQRHSVSLEPEIGFQIFIEAAPSTTVSTSAEGYGNSTVSGSDGGRTMVPELNVLLISARHLPSVFGFKLVQGYNIKVKLFPGTKRYDSSIQTNSWPKFNENFRFPLAPDKKSSIKSYTKGRSSEFLPEDLFTGHFVVFTVYALLELPPANLSRFNKTYRSLRERSSSLVQKVVDSSSAKPKDVDAFTKNAKVDNAKTPEPVQLTSSEAKRNIGSVTCYLEPKLFRRNPRTGQFCTDELWLPIKDITTTVLKDSNSLTQSPKGVVELILELQDSTNNEIKDSTSTLDSSNDQKPSQVKPLNGSRSSWRGLSEVRRKIGRTSSKIDKGLQLKVSTSRMRCSNKVKDELESSAGSIYLKTTVFEHNIYSDSWKSPYFFPSLSIKWDCNESTVTIPIKQPEDLNNILVKTTLATKTKMGKKMFLGTVMLGGDLSGSGLEHWQKLENTRNERIAMWHSFQ